MKNAKKLLTLLLAFFVLVSSSAEVLAGAVNTSTYTMTSNQKGAAKKKDLVIVLDAGHGGSDPGTTGSGLKEKDITLKIAKYCKEELETYDGVKIYMTRTGDTYPSLTDRVAYADRVKADLFVSLHINAFITSSAKGAEVYYPNANYKPELGSQGKVLAGKIQSQLVGLGLYNRGAKILSSTATKYPDGSAADYYAVIRGSKEAGILGVLVEHAFISNASDVATFLSTDASIKKMAVADANGIAEYYGLKKKTSLAATKIQAAGTSEDATAINLTWKKIKKATGYQIYRAVGEKGKYKKVADIKDKKVVNWTDTNIKAGKTYCYKIRAYNAETKAAYSAIQKVKMLKAPQLTKVKASAKALKLTWKSVSGAAKYQIYRSTMPNGEYKRIATVKKNILTYEDKSVEAGVKYYYKLRAIGSGLKAKTYSPYGNIKGKKTK